MKMILVFTIIIFFAAMGTISEQRAVIPLRCDIIGQASWYGNREAGRQTASGERFDPSLLTAAHRRLAFGTRVKVVNLENRRSVIITVNDRGPFVKGRVIDFSLRAAKDLYMLEKGVQKVCIIKLN